MWEQSIQEFSRNKFRLDPMLNSNTDNRYGLSVVAQPSAAVKQKILRVLEEIRTVAPNQYFYPESDLHVTILSIISCYEGFSLSQIERSEYQKIVHSATEAIHPFEIEFNGLTASPAGILIQGFPAGEQLSDVRNELRHRFKKSGLHHSIDSRYTLQTAHMTVVRFKKPLDNPEKFLEKITRLRHTWFGRCLVDQVDLVGTDWYHQHEKVEPIKQFPLNEQ